MPFTTMFIYTLQHRDKVNSFALTSNPRNTYFGIAEQSAHRKELRWKCGIITKKLLLEAYSKAHPETQYIRRRRNQYARVLSNKQTSPIRSTRG